MKKERLDTLLVERGLCADEAEALRAVLSREVKVNGEYAKSAAVRIAPDAEISVKQSDRFVTRGGHKLQAALDAFGQEVAGLRCADVGCSHGGFTDCLLQAGAASVAAIDVGYGDLDWRLRQDPRVAVFERTNIRTADPVQLGAPFDLVVADLSFIGLASLAPTFAKLSVHGTVFIGLVKPQFESHPEEVDGQGYVSDQSVRERTVEEVSQALAQVGFACENVLESPLTGRKSHNVEYLVRAIYYNHG